MAASADDQRLMSAAFADAMPKKEKPKRKSRFLRPPPTPDQCVPEEMKGSPVEKEVELMITIMAEAMHVGSLFQLVMEEKTDKTTIGLNGSELERDYCRLGDGGTKMTIVHAALMATVGKRLKEAFPDDTVLCEEDAEVLGRDEDYAQTVATLLSEFQVIEGATAESTTDWVRHSVSALQSSDSPTRYWVLKPVDSTEEFREQKNWCISLALIENNEPVVSGIACPVMAYDHVSRSVPSPKGCPIFFAAKGLGAWTQHVIIDRVDGVYAGNSYLKGWPLKLNVSDKIKRGHDGLYDFLGAEQLHIAMNGRLREDIFRDAERIGKILGSEYPKYEFTNSSIKYCWLARGEADVCMWLVKGLFDDAKGTEHIIDHAAGCLVAQEAGADVSDFDGNPVDWCGPLLTKNRGLLATDPTKVPLKGLTGAIKNASDTSNELYEKRCEKRKEVAKMLSYVFSKLGDFAENDEEREGAKKVFEKGMKLLKDEEEMMKITQESINRSEPILGQGRTEEDAFSSGDDNLPMSPIST